MGIPGFSAAAALGPRYGRYQTIRSGSWRWIAWGSAVRALDLAWRHWEFEFAPSCSKSACWAKATAMIDGCYKRCNVSWGGTPCFAKCSQMQSDSWVSCTTTGCLPGDHCDTGKCCHVGEANCGGSGCTNIWSGDPANCGGCGQACADCSRCEGGTCRYICSPIQGCCDDGCKDLQTDPKFCGKCDEGECRPGEVCIEGKCTCLPPRTICAGSCVDTRTDPKHCGELCTVCTGATPLCDAGKCHACPIGSAPCGGGCCPDANVCCYGACCPPGQRCCGGTCTDVTTVTHCGDCGTQCGYGHVCVLKDGKRVCECPPGTSWVSPDACCPSGQYFNTKTKSCVLS